MRKTGHLQAALHGRNYYISKAIRKWGIDSFDWSILFESNDNDILCEKECELIAKYGTLRPFGYNITPVGEGVRHTAEMRKAKRELALKQHSDPEKRRRWEEGIKKADHSRKAELTAIRFADPEYRAKWSAMVKSSFTEDTKKKMADAMKKRMEEKYGTQKEREIRKRVNQVYRALIGHRMYEQSVERNKVDVFCIELDKTFPSVKQAGKELGLDRRLISAVLNGKQHTAGGYHFRRASNDKS